MMEARKKMRGRRSTYRVASKRQLDLVPVLYTFDHILDDIIVKG